MNLSPHQIAAELSTFPFFKNFGNDILLQIAGLVKARSYHQDEIILKEGDINNSLHFVRKGKVSLSLIGEVFKTIDTVGEVFGEMSVITNTPVSTMVQAKSEVDCFILRAADFDQVQTADKNHFQLLLYKIYCNILTERLLRTNEKARLFEIMNREMHEAQKKLRDSTMNKVLLIESDKKRQFIVRMALGGTGMHLDTAETADEAKTLLGSHKYNVILCEESCIDVLRMSTEQKLAEYNVLLSARSAETNAELLRNNSFVENIMCYDSEDRSLTIRFLLATLSKLLNKEIFGLEKYLTWGVEVQRRLVCNSQEREPLREGVMEYFKKMGVRSSILTRINTVLEEMLMNAIYDAPVDGQGKALFNHLSRREEVALDTHQQSQLCYGSDGVFLAVAVVDPFGAFSKDILIRYLNSVYTGQAGSLNTGKGGAGRGLHQIIENADLTIFNSRKGVRNEVICLFNVDGVKRSGQPTFHYFFS